MPRFRILLSRNEGREGSFLAPSNVRAHAQGHDQDRTEQLEVPVCAPHQCQPSAAVTVKLRSSPNPQLLEPRKRPRD
jgi:hypothetical protein